MIVSRAGHVSLATLGGGVCAPRDPPEAGEHTLRLSVHNPSLSKPIPIWDVRCRALWCMDLSSFDIIAEPTEDLAASTRYQDVVHPCLANNLAWLTSHNEALYAHFSALEQEPRYQWDLSYVARLKKVTNIDRVEIVDIMVRPNSFVISFSLSPLQHRYTYYLPAHFNTIV